MQRKNSARTLQRCLVSLRKTSIFGEIYALFHLKLLDALTLSAMKILRKIQRIIFINLRADSFFIDANLATFKEFYAVFALPVSQQEAPQSVPSSLGFFSAAHPEINPPPPPGLPPRREPRNPRRNPRVDARFCRLEREPCVHRLIRPTV